MTRISSPPESARPAHLTAEARVQEDGLWLEGVLRREYAQGDLAQVDGSYVLLTQPRARTSVAVAGGAAIGGRKFRIRRLKTLPALVAIEEMDEATLFANTDDDT